MIAPSQCSKPHVIQGFETVDSQSEEVAQKLLSDAESETRDCSQAVVGMMEATAMIRDTINPSISYNRGELKRLFNIIDAVEDKVIPALNEDLTALENLVSILEIQKARDQPQTIKDWAVTLLSASTDSNDADGHSPNNDLPEIRLHERATFHNLINQLKHDPITSSSSSTNEITQTTSLGVKDPI